MHRERLETLKAFLKKLDPPQFDIKTWKRKWVHGCEMAACAGGWACEIEEFEQAGLHRVHTHPAYNGRVSYNALSDFFDLSTDATKFVFDPSAYPNERNEDNGEWHVDAPLSVVIDRIQALLDDDALGAGSQSLIGEKTCS